MHGIQPDAGQKLGPVMILCNVKKSTRRSHLLGSLTPGLTRSGQRVTGVEPCRPTLGLLGPAEPHERGAGGRLAASLCLAAGPPLTPGRGLPPSRPPRPRLRGRTRAGRVYSPRPAFHSRHARSRPRPRGPVQRSPHESRPHPRFSREVSTPGRTGGKCLLGRGGKGGAGGRLWDRARAGGRRRSYQRVSPVNLSRSAVRQEAPLPLRPAPASRAGVSPPSLCWTGALRRWPGLSEEEGGA